MVILQETVVKCSMSQNEVLDVEGFLRRIGGDLEIAEAVVDGFVQDIPHRFAMLKAASQAGDATLMRQHAHAIHGAAVNIGAKQLATTVRAVEEHAKASEVGVAVGLLPEVELRLERLQQAIQEWRAK